jgi:hypothetical protein
MDTIKIKILSDGTIKMETDAVSMPNHVNAEGFIRDCGRLTGGDVERKNKKGIQHTHDGIHWHSAERAHN